ncbi:MAG: Uma2 family endonuclease, partial [Deltaproteobacteria bacterium]|nr:Uma2 family endonuclease [Deltaproteobacteria bacterium]
MTRLGAKPASGPFRADQIRCGDPYELSDGHPIRLSPTAGRGAGAVSHGATALGTDPAATEAGVDAGYSPDPGTLRAPDVAVGNVPDAPGWIRGVPALAVEYADTGQNEDDLAQKIDELLAAGTKLVWVVRLAGARRVEVHQQGNP